MVNLSYKGLFTYYVSRRRGEGVWQMMTIADEGGRGVSRKVTIADKGGWSQKNVQKTEIMGTEKVDKENN